MCFVFLNFSAQFLSRNMKSPWVSTCVSTWSIVEANTHLRKCTFTGVLYFQRNFQFASTVVRRDVSFLAPECCVTKPDTEWVIFELRVISFVWWMVIRVSRFSEVVNYCTLLCVFYRYFTCLFLSAYSCSDCCGTFFDTKNFDGLAFCFLAVSNVIIAGWPCCTSTCSQFYFLTLHNRSFFLHCCASCIITCYCSGGNSHSCN